MFTKVIAQKRVVERVEGNITLVSWERIEVPMHTDDIYVAFILAVAAGGDPIRTMRYIHD
jgi:hypothetical protein